MEATPSDNDPDLFSSICGLTNFVINTETVLTVDRKLTPSEVSVLSSFLISGAEITYLDLREKLPPGAASQLGPAINRPTTLIRTLPLGNHYKYTTGLAEELFRTFVVSANPALLQLSINNCFLGGWFSPWPSDSFERLTALRSLTMTASNNYTYCPPELIADIGKLRTLESLSTLKIVCESEEAKALAEALNDLPMLAELEIISARVTVDIARAIGDVVGRGRIRKLRLGSSELEDKEASALTDAILASRRGSSRCELQELDLSDNRIGPTGGQRLSEGLIARSSRLRILSLAGNPIGDAAAEILGKALTPQQSLGELDVSRCDLGPRGVGSLMNALLLLRPPAFSVLRIGGNCQEDPGARAIAGFLRSSSGRRLLELEIRYSGITEVGALELSTVFAGIYTLKRLDTCGNLIGPRGAVAIIDALVAASSTIPMDIINFSNCEIEDDGASAVGRLIAHRGCMHMSLSGSHVHIAGAKAIADSVAVSACPIEMLDLSRNPINDEGVIYLLDKIIQSRPRKRFVRMLDIEGASMSVGAAMAVKRMVEADGVIYELVVSRPKKNEKACGILEEAERDSKSSGNVMLVLL